MKIVCNFCNKAIYPILNAELGLFKSGLMSYEDVQLMIYISCPYCSRIVATCHTELNRDHVVKGWKRYCGKDVLMIRENTGGSKDEEANKNCNTPPL